MASFGHLGLRSGRHLRFASPRAEAQKVAVTTQLDTDKDRRRRLEAVLFLAPQGITTRRAAKIADLEDATEVRTLIRQLNEIYDCQFRPYRIEEVAGGYAIMTRGRLSSWLRKLSYLPGEFRLGRTVLETLAIVAYRQPVMRADIEAIRGVSSSEALKQLMELDLVRINGRSEDLGRPYLYGTTLRFLQMFGLRSADRLPRIKRVEFVTPVDTISPISKTPIIEDFALDSEAKESTVKRTIDVTNFSGEETMDEILLASTAAVLPISAIDEDDDEDWDDEEDDDDFDDEDDEDDDDLEDWEDEEDEEEDLTEEEEESDDAEEEAEEEEEWEEVGDEEADEEEKEESEEDEDDWDDDDDDDWEDDDDEEDDWE